MSSAIAVIDFETTGMSPAQGARATEVAIVLLEQGRVVDRYQSLMQTGAWVSPFITDLTDFYRSGQDCSVFILFLLLNQRLLQPLPLPCPL